MRTRSTKTRVRRLERAHGGAAVAGGEKLWALLLYARTATRRQALQGLWLEEQRDAAKQGRPPDPQRVLTLMRLLDTCTWPVMIKNGRDHRRKTYFANDYSAWSREEVLLWIRLGEFGAPPPSEAEMELVVGLVAKTDALDARAEAVWQQDGREMRLIVGGPEVGAIS
jgi:hypothetical protein